MRDLRVLKKDLNFLSKRKSIFLRIFGLYLKYLFSKITLRGIVLAVTYGCNANCKHCYAEGLKSRAKCDMSLQDFKKIVNEAVNLGLIHINFMGGEPLLHKDIIKMITYANSKEVISSLNTNAYLLDKKRCRELKKAGLDIVFISLNSANPGKHDSFCRLEGSFNRCLKAIKYCKEEGIPVQLTYSATPYNIKTNDFIDFLNLAKKNNLIVNLTFPIKMGRFKDNCSLKLKDIKYVKSLNIVPINVNDERSLFKHKCVAGIEKIYIGPQGEVSPCPAIQISYGNILEEPLSKIIKKMKKDPILKKLKSSARFPCQDKRIKKIFLDKINTKKNLPLDYNIVIKFFYKDFKNFK